MCAKEDAAQKGIELVDLDTLLARSDFITVHVPLLKETKDLLNRENLARTKKGVFIINTARGGIVNEKDLYEALDAGQVAGAALDVFEHGAAAKGPPARPFRKGRRHPAPRRIHERGAKQGGHRHSEPDHGLTR